MKKAKYFEVSGDHKVKCLLCPHHCVIEQGETGICQARKNIDGVLYSENYGRVSSLGKDPVEKKPLYHFYPDQKILSLGTYGCNFNCRFCQNWQISQQIPSVREYNPEEVINKVERNKVIGIAYTYSEPSVWFEFVLETAKAAHKKGLKNVLVSNAYINQDPLMELIPYLDAANVDLKSFNSEFYKKICGGKLEPVLENIKLLSGKVHLELTTLIVPGLNDSRKELRQLFKWVNKFDRQIPLHLSRYFPEYKLKRSATPIKKMQEAYQLAREYLDYVYLGNMSVSAASNTYCPECNEPVLIRDGYLVENKLNGDKCPECGYKLPVVIE